MNINMCKFHEMEIKYRLFALGREDNYPVWDLIRVELFDYLSSGSSSINVQKHNGRNFLVYLRCLWSSLELFFRRKKIVFFECARDKNNVGVYYDHISYQLINSVDKNKRIVINLLNSVPTYYKDRNLFLFKLLGKLYFTRKKLSTDSFQIIEDAIREMFNSEITYSYINSIYIKHLKNQFLYRLLFKIISPSKIFVSCDLQKDIYIVAKEINVITYEMQHAGVVFQYPSYSYPDGVDMSSNVAFADYFLLFGKEWMNVNNIPTRRIVIGNDYFFPLSPQRNIETPYVVIITNKVHSRYLKTITKDMAFRMKEVVFLYKLHPNEYSDVEVYKSFFAGFNNVRIITSGYDLTSIIYYSEMLILVYSSVCYEALNMKKKVAILKVDGYESYGDILDKCKNARFVNNVNEIESFYKENIKGVEVSYFSRFDQNVAQKVING